MVLRMRGISAVFFVSVLAALCLAPAAFAQPGPGGQGLLTVPAQGDVKGYDLVGIAVPLILAYAATYALSKKGMISVTAHRRLWNAALLAAFAIVGVLGVLLVIRIDYGFAVLQNFFMLYWHVEAGIAMVVISAFHVAWHWRYYACVFKTGGGAKCDS